MGKATKLVVVKHTSGQEDMPDIMILQDLSVKKRKSEEDNSEIDIQETKDKIKFKLENIRNLKEEM